MCVSNGPAPYKYFRKEKLINQLRVPTNEPPSSYKTQVCGMQYVYSVLAVVVCMRINQTVLVCR